jgi:GTP-binding protein
MIDQVQIYVKGGRGGHGGMTFHRAKYIPKGGPDGGNGGQGGSVIIQATHSMRTLAPFKYKKKYQATDGGDGISNKRSGKNGEDIIVRVPVGTLVKDRTTGEILADLCIDGQKIIAAKGGRGGLGNYNFTTSTRQSPRFAQGGSKGEERTLILELKLIADVGLLGFPNVGKSTFLSVVTKATPKIGNYPFTTIEPNLGVVEWKNFDSFVIEDVPGIIEGASKGVGLGLQFLRHLERTKLFLHFLDVSQTAVMGEKPLDCFDKINTELKAYNPKMINKPQIVVLSKSDLADPETVNKVTKELKARQYPVFTISSVTNNGIDQLLGYTIKMLKEIPDQKPIVSEEKNDIDVDRIYTIKSSGPKFSIEKQQRGPDNIYVVKGDFDQLIHSVNFDDLISTRYFQRRLKEAGVFKALEEKGIQDEDIVSIEGIEFEYFK